jgi:hypothetical protein
LPTLLCGRGGEFKSPGRHIVYQRETPVCNLFATMIERVGVRAEHGRFDRHVEWIVTELRGKAVGIATAFGAVAKPAKGRPAAEAALGVGPQRTSL